MNEDRGWGWDSLQSVKVKIVDLKIADALVLILQFTLNVDLDTLEDQQSLLE